MAMALSSWINELKSCREAYYATTASLHKQGAIVSHRIIMDIAFMSIDRPRDQSV